MQKILLTSSGFDNKNIAFKFKELINKHNDDIKVLFIPTASMENENYDYINLCKQELLNIGVLDSNIYTHNLDFSISHEEITSFDAIYVCGGNTQYLFEAMERVNFKNALNAFFASDKVYIGVSAGSIVLNYLGYFTSRLEVHCNDGSPVGAVQDSPSNCIKLADNQAVLFVDDTMVLFE